MRKVLILCFAPLALHAQRVPQRKLQVTVSDLHALVRDLFASADPRDPANAYMSPKMKSSIAEVRDRVRRGELDTIVVAQNYNTETDPARLMEALWKDGKPVSIRINASMLWAVAHPRGLSAGAVDPSTRTTFELSLFHEALHLEALPDVSTPAKRINEEARVWRLVSLYGVRPLRKAHQPLSPAFVEVDSVLKRCRDRLACTAFRKQIESQYRAAP